MTADTSSGIGTVTVTVPIDLVLAVRSSAQMSRDGISDDYEGDRHKGRRYEDLARRRAVEIAELDRLLGQLGEDEGQGREVAGDYETLHGVVGDTLMEAIEELKVVVGTCWRHEEPVATVDRQMDVVRERVELLREVERAADEIRDRDRDTGNGG